MRLVDVHLVADRPLDVVLHPRLTVITGDVPACSRVVEVLARAFSLAGSELTGSVEYGGFATPLDQTGVVSLDLPGEGLVVITPTDLPAPDRHRHDQELASAQHRRAEAAEAAVGSAAALDGLRRRMQATEAGVQVGREEHDATQRRLVELRERLTQLESDAQQAEAELAGRQATVMALTERLAEQTVLAPAVVAALDAVEGAGRSLRLGHDLTAQRELTQRATACGLFDEPTGAAVADWLTSVQAGTAPHDPAVDHLLADVADLERRWAEVSALGVEDEPQVIEARNRHEELAARLGALEGLFASGVLEAQARSEIDAAHAERLRVEGERTRERTVTEAVAREQEVVGRYGFDSYLEYTIALSTRSVGDAVEATLHRVRAETVGASDALDAVREAAAANRHAVAEERAAARRQLQELVGTEVEDLSVEELRRVPALPPELVDLEARLHAVVAATAAQREAAESELVAAERFVGGASGEADALRAELDQRAEVAAALAPLISRAEAEHLEVLGAVASAEQQATVAASAVQHCDAEIAELMAAPLDAYGPADVPAVVSHLTPLLDPPGAEPVPVLMVDTFRPLGEHATAALEAMMVAAVRVQMVYVTDDPAVLAWARGLGPSAGQLLRLHRPGWFQRRMARRGSSQSVNPAGHPSVS